MAAPRPGPPRRKITIYNWSTRARDAFEEFGGLIAELLKLAALLVFGALLTPDLIAGLPLGSWLVAVLAILVVRPAALLLSLVRTGMDRREKIAVAWFGPKGFASVVYGLLVLSSGIPEAEDVFELVAVCIALSIVAHSSTDVPVARLFDVREALNQPDQSDAARGRAGPAPSEPTPSDGDGVSP